MDDVSKMGSQGPNRFVRSAHEVGDIIDPATGKVDATKWKEVKGIEGVATPLDGMYIKAPIYDQIFNTMKATGSDIMVLWHFFHAWYKIYKTSLKL